MSLPDPVTEYAQRVLDGDLVAGPYAIWACQRHLRDLERDDIYLDLETVHVHLDFFSLLKHYKGRWAGQVITLELWQKFIQGSIFGWKRISNGKRRFREAYIEIPRKNGKSLIAAGTGIYGLSLDGESGAEIYAVATKRDQAKIVWNDAKTMIEKSKSLSKRINCYVSNISMPSTASKFEPLGRDSKTQDGLNPHFGIIDELHAWEDRLMWDQVEDAMGSREQPLIYSITTAGTSTESLCYEKHEHAINVLNPDMDGYDDDTLFTYIATVADKDVFDEPLQWAMANPNLQVAKNLDYMQEQYRKALQQPSRMTAFKVKQLNIWQNAASRWLDLEKWNEAKNESLKIEDFVGQECYLGLDLAEVNDTSSLVALFPGGDDVWRIFSWHWCPEVNIKARSKFDKVPYDKWAKWGYLISTPGEATDYDFIEKQICDLVEMLNVKELLYDRWKASGIIQNLIREEVVTCVGYGQGYKDASPALKEVERRLMGEKFQHAPSPVLNWHASNAEVVSDPAGSIKLNKRLPRKRIDGLSALANAAGGAILNRELDGPGEYQGMGVLEL